MTRPWTMLAVGIFVFVTAAHLCRLFHGWDLAIAGRGKRMRLGASGVGGWNAVPIWASNPGAILPGALACLLWHEAKAGHR